MINRHSPILIVLLAGLLFAACGSGSKEKENPDDFRIITDMAGREVKIPNEIGSAFIDRHSVFLLYALDTVISVNKVFQYNESEKKYLKKSFYENKPYAIEDAREEILRLNPDVVLYSQPITDDAIEKVDLLQKTVNTPVLLMDIRVDKYKDALVFLGEVLHKREKAAELRNFIETRVEPVVKKAKSISPGQRKRIYYAEGMNGLQTDPSGSIHSYLFDLLGAINVAEADILPGKGMTGVSPEQVYHWNPDMIIVWSGNFDGLNSYKYIRTHKTWSLLDAVKRGEVYQVPWRPFGWIDRPPGLNRLIGIIWLSKILYPDVFSDDIVPVVQEFFEKFYHYSLTEEEAKDIMNPFPVIHD
ncbi:MAG: ABC transporter substrate-binding protein [Proteiniphilum sp.]|jgi:iron complex transport system substrate-binding protein|nr:ABC transporter substrate-binding protein [Proteiniphilum sp.]